MIVLTTGATGFVGNHLCRHLANNNVEVFGTTLTDAGKANNENSIIYECDLLNYGQVEQLIAKVKPDHIIHLAAIASVADAWKEPKKILFNNIGAQLNIFKALIEHRLKPRVLIASTGEVYGAVDQDELPIDEKASLKPNNPYAVSKVSQEFLGLQYFISHQIPVIITRAFNHSGPGQSEHFVIGAFAKQVADIEKNLKEPVIEVGNLEAERDFLDVRDVVKAYWLLSQKGKAGEIYNICSAKSVKIQKILDLLLENAKKKIDIKQDPARMRPVDTPVVVGDNTKIKAATGWKASISLENTLLDTLNYMRTSSSSLQPARH